MAAEDEEEDEDKKEEEAGLGATNWAEEGRSTVSLAAASTGAAGMLLDPTAATVTSSAH